jgi:hypothetical protein
MFEEQISQMIHVFQSLDGIPKAVFVFWMISAVAFYSAFTYIIVTLIKKGILRIIKPSGI